MERVITNTLEAASHPERGSSPAYMTDLLESWIAAGCRWESWQNDNPGMAWKLRQRLEAQWRARIYPGRDGRPEPVLLGASGFEPDAPQKANTDEDLAYDLFAVFLVAAAPRAEVGVCEREKCRKYYWNRWGHLNKRFCSRECSRRETASEGQTEKTREKRREKIARLKRAIRECISENPSERDRRRWVAERAGVSLNFLTRAIRADQQAKPGGLTLTKAQRKFLGGRRERERLSVDG
jgi:hypothetical protein